MSRRTTVTIAITAVLSAIMTMIGVGVAGADPSLHTPTGIGRVNVSGTGYVAPYENVLLAGNTNTDNVVYSGTSHIIDTNWNSAGSVYVFYDRDVSFCSVQVTPTSRFWYASAVPSGPAHKTRVLVNTWNVTDAGIETSGDVAFNIGVTC